MKYYRIGIAGSGNLAWHLTQDLEKAGHYIPAIYGRNQENAQLLATQLYDTRVLSEPDFSELELDVLILAVSDDAIEPLSREIIVGEETVVVHTSGAKPLDLLEHLEINYGVFYPLQTFTKEKAIDFSDVPICIEASSTRVHEVLFAIARSLSQKVVVMDSKDRKVLHLAAVFTNNFCNHLLFRAKTITDAEGIDFQLLKPLARETVEKAFFLTPELAQTGPARRGDQGTMKKHLAMLEGNTELQNLYKTLSINIQYNS